MQEIFATMKRLNLRKIGIAAGADSHAQAQENAFNKIRSEIFQNQKKDMPIFIQEPYGKPNRFDQKKILPTV